MNEAQRQASLSAMGISMWYARGPLPGAAPSPVFDWVCPEAVVPRPSSPVEVPVPDAPAGSVPEKVRGDRPIKPSLASVRESLVGESPEKTPAPGDSPASMAENTSGPGAPEPGTLLHENPSGPQTLRLEGAFQSGLRLNLAMDLSQELSESVQLALAGNILRALGESPAEPVQPLSWPVFANPSVPGNDDEGLLRVVTGLMASHQGRPWLVLGEQMQSLFSALAEKSPEVAPVWLTSPLSLQALAADPASKGRLWQQLQQALAEKPLAAIEGAP